MVRALLLLSALVANSVLFAAAWTKGSTADDQSDIWYPCPEGVCDYEDEES